MCRIGGAGSLKLTYGLLHQPLQSFNFRAKQISLGLGSPVPD
jgi:hypothetical protein